MGVVKCAPDLSGSEPEHAHEVTQLGFGQAFDVANGLGAKRVLVQTGDLVADQRGEVDLERGGELLQDLKGGVALASLQFPAVLVVDAGAFAKFHLGQATCLAEGSKVLTELFHRVGHRVRIVAVLTATLYPAIACKSAALVVDRVPK